MKTTPSPSVAFDGNLWTRATRYATVDSHTAIVNDCATLILEGINGLRLPQIAELSALDYKIGGLNECPTCNPAIDQSAFPDTDAAMKNNAYVEPIRRAIAEFTIRCSSPAGTARSRR